MEGSSMEIRLIRNATLRLRYAGRRILIDPFLSPMHAIDSFAGISPNPTVDLPCQPEEVYDGSELVLVSHLHPDHFDEEAQRRLPKDRPVYCQPGDEATIAAKGFVQVTPIAESITWNSIQITRTPGRHGTGVWAERMGQVSGFLLRANGEPTIYWLGDTIWYEPVEQILSVLKPDLVVTHSGGARFGDDDPIIMDAPQTLQVCQAVPEATVVAVHMESLDHCTTTRAELRRAADEAGISVERLRIPDDGESLVIEIK